MPEILPSNSAHSQFVALLREMFQIQDLDLDFGIYRVLNQEKTLIKTFLDERLAPITREALGAADDSQRAGLEKELTEVVEASQKYKFPLEESDDYKRIKAELDALGNSDALETEVYNGLADFFARYYDKGDFLSRPRYRKDVYALPYNGEEVKLHWANRDQYYIKSAQVLETFEWKLGDLRVRFALRPEHSQHAENNNKEERRFVLALDENDNPIVTSEEEGGAVLTVFFDFKKTSGGPRDLNAAAEKTLREWSDADSEAAKLLAPILATFSRTEKTEKSHFLHRLNSWTARGSFDFFVHKDLEGFLSRELDFYLKNEVVHLDALLQDKSAQWEKTTLAKARAMHALGRKIIAFLASLEELQKRLWEKQKWITSTRLVLPLSKVPTSLRAEVLANAAQRDEWKTLYGVDVDDNGIATVAAASAPPDATNSLFDGTEAVATVFPDIAIDTKHFDAAFARRLWSELSREYSIDELWNGVLWNADNFAALNLMQKRFKEEIKCIYIDPPYNTGGDGFLYKDSYQHSSWLSMMQDRLQLARELMRDDAAIFVSCDDQEQVNAREILGQVFGTDNFAGNIIWKKKTNGNNMGFIPPVHDFMVTCGKLLGEKTILEIGHTDEYIESKYSNPDNDARGEWTVSDLSANHVGPYFPITNPETKEEFLPPAGRYWVFNAEEVIRRIGDGRIIFGKTGTGRPVQKKFKSEMRPTRKIDSLWDSQGYNSDGTAEIASMLSAKAFINPKPTKLLMTVGEIGANSDSLILDYFAGSGTTGHAVINLNRADGANGQRRFVLVEMGRYFDSVLVPRLKKAAFADKWRDGKPSEYSNRGGVAQTLMIHSLESYEDALEHLAAAVEDNAQPALSAPDDEFTVRYALSLKTRDGELPLSDALFQTPFALQMRGGNDHTSSFATDGTMPQRTVTPDAIATFNWLLGLRVHKLWFPDALGGAEAAATDTRTDTEPKLAAVCGLLPDGRAAVVVWRHLKDESYETADAALLEFWQSDEILQSWRNEYSISVVYVNGDSTLWRTRTASEDWRCEPLETTFRELMFAASPRREAF